MTPDVTLEDLQAFEFDRVLNEDAPHRRITLLGSLKGETALLLLEKTLFDAASMGQYTDSLLNVTSLGANDVYRWVLGQTKLPDVKITMVCPATSTHIKKHEPQQSRLVRETPEHFEAIVRPYMDSIPPERMQWVWNFLAKTSEGEKILFEDPDPASGFIIGPDLKWDTNTLNQLYLQAVVHNRSLRTLRDLKLQHVPMLKNIIKQSESIAAGYGLEPGLVRCYVHYQPSYYQFHVHIMHVECETTSRNISLDDVVDNILLDQSASFYQRKTLTYELGTKHPLFEAMWAAQTSKPEPPPDGQGWKGVSLWLVPTRREHRKALSAVIDKLAQEHNTPQFVPHVTLLSSLPFDIDTAKLADAVTNATATFRQSSRTSNSLELSLASPGHREDVYYQSLFMHMAENTGLLALRKNLQQELIINNLPVPSGAQYMPHLSLLYSSKMQVERKRRILENLEKAQVMSTHDGISSLAGVSTLEMSEIWIVRSEHGVDSWQIIKQINM